MKINAIVINVFAWIATCIAISVAIIVTGKLWTLALFIVPGIFCSPWVYAVKRESEHDE